MILAIDIGNTNIVVGCFDKEEVLFVERVSTDHTKTELEYAISLKNVLEIYDINPKQVEGGIVSSVVPPLTNVLKASAEKIISGEVLVVGPGIKTGLNILMDNPASVGSDLIVDAVAAIHEYPAPLIFIDMGTATKMMFVDSNGAFRGVSIIPGVQISIKALTGGTAQLPQISLDAPSSVIGKNTIDCMKSGVIYGNASLIDGMIDRITKECGISPKLIATGGLAESIIPYCEHEIMIDRYLVLEGLKIIYNKNV